MHHVAAFAFSCPFELPEMARRLNALGRHEWIVGDSAWYGDYLKVWTYQGHGERVRLRIYEFSEDEPPFVVEIIFESEAPEAEGIWQGVLAHVQQEVLPALEAKSIRPTASID